MEVACCSLQQGVSSSTSIGLSLLSYQQILIVVLVTLLTGIVPEKSAIIRNIIGTRIITNSIVGVPYQKYSIMGPKPYPNY